MRDECDEAPTNLEAAMSEFTKVNLREVEDMAPRFDLSPGLESRFAREPLELEGAGVSLFRLAPGFRTPFGHRHEEQEEVYVVLSGMARLSVEDEIVELGPMDAVRVAPTAARCLEDGPDGAEVLAFGAPTHDNRDAQMLPGWWRGGSNDSAA
jgi:mannose-6-phosphate isomerase-like protein (cupin superfamily)